MKTIHLDPILHAYHLSGAQVTHQTESLHTAYHIQHPSGNHIVKRLTFPPDDTQHQKLTLSCRLMAHLHTQGFPCPNPLINQQGHFVTEYNGQHYQAFTVIPGQPDWNTITPNRIQQTGELLGKFHRLQQTFPDMPPPVDLQDRIKMGMQRIIAEWETYPITRNDIRLAAHEALSNIHTLWSPLQTLPTGLMHTDATPGNVFFHGEHLTGLIDFEVIPGAFLLDLCMAALRWADAFDPTTQMNHLDTNKLKQFLTAYNNTRPLNPLETDALKNSLLLAAIWSWSRQRPHRANDPAFRLTSRGDIVLAVQNLNLSG